MDMLIAVLERWLSQDVARRNAQQAAVRLQHRRRQLDDLEAFLATHLHDPGRPVSLGSGSTATVQVRPPRPASL